MLCTEKYLREISEERQKAVAKCDDVARVDETLQQSVGVGDCRLDVKEAGLVPRPLPGCRQVRESLHLLHIAICQEARVLVQDAEQGLTDEVRQ